MRTIIVIAALGVGSLLISCSSGSNGSSPTSSVDPLGSSPTDTGVDGSQVPDAGDLPDNGGEIDGTVPDVDGGTSDTVDPVDQLPDLSDAGDIGPLTPDLVIDDILELPAPWGPFQPFAGSAHALSTFPRTEVVSGGPGKDGIPALTNPSFVAADQVTYMAEHDLVLGLVINGEARAYPHNIGWWHEIVNDVVGGKPVCVSFCPLTGTGMVFDAEDADGSQFELGVSGLLYNNNLIMYDRRDGNTLYPQIFFTGIEGQRSGESLELMPVVETTWETWKRLHPETLVVEGGTYSTSRYQQYPYGNYRFDDNFILFGLNPTIASNPNPMASAFGEKDGMLGVRLNGEPKAYRFQDMGSRAVINDRVGDVDVVVVWDERAELAIPYARQAGGRDLTFDIEPGGFPFSLRDRETGSLWDINGVAIDGELTGHRLTQVPAHNSFWFAWVTFFEESSVWQP